MSRIRLETGLNYFLRKVAGILYENPEFRGHETEFMSPEFSSFVVSIKTWSFVRVPKSITKKLIHKADRGVIAIHAKTGNTSWDTSLLPMGDGTHFIALNAKVRKKEKINLGDKTEIVFQLRN